MRLLVVTDYRNRDIEYKAGLVLECQPATAAALMADSPGSFRVLKEEEKAVEKAPVDRMIRKEGKRK